MKIEMSARRGRSRRRRPDRVKEVNCFPWTDCCLCRTPEGSKMQFGTWFQDAEAELSAHQYCLLFSAGLPQRGNDSEGFEGFLYEDIYKELSRSKRIKCKFCSRSGASLGCAVKSCRISFHYSCGLKQNFQYEFMGTFRTHCSQHRCFQDLSYIMKASEILSCPICLENINKPEVSILKMPCCKNQFAHKECIQNQAMASGYFFTCPTCKNEKEFQAEMARFGIYIPKRDASWEKDNAFSYLYQQYGRCDVTDCQCPNGRNYVLEDSPWDLIRCHHCGQGAVHEYCIGKNKHPLYGYLCRDCGASSESKKKDLSFVSVNSEEQYKTHQKLLNESFDKGELLPLSYINCRRFNVKPCSVVLQKLSQDILKKYNLENCGLPSSSKYFKHGQEKKLKSQSLPMKSGLFDSNKHSPMCSSPTVHLPEELVKVDHFEFTVSEEIELIKSDFSTASNEDSHRDEGYPSKHNGIDFLNRSKIHLPESSLDVINGVSTLQYSPNFKIVDSSESNQPLIHYSQSPYSRAASNQKIYMNLSPKKLNLNRECEKPVFDTQISSVRRRIWSKRRRRAKCANKDTVNTRSKITYYFNSLLDRSSEGTL